MKFSNICSPKKTIQGYDQQIFETVILWDILKSNFNNAETWNKESSIKFDSSDYQGHLSTSLSVPWEFRRRHRASMGLRPEGKMNSPVCTFLYQFPYISPAILPYSVKFPFYKHK